MRYFKGAYTANSLLWETSWKNYMLYLGAIQSEEDEKPKEKIEVKDSDDIF
ncbi:hypothetical protein FHT21_000796 [Pedobacter sp. SG908]|nr:hypothetical protein [Pedobacter sp. SG908]